MAVQTGKVSLRIRELREERNITQAELARRLGVSPAAVLFWEKGRNVPGAARLLHIAKILECKTDDLYREEVAK